MKKRIEEEKKDKREKSAQPKRLRRVGSLGAGLVGGKGKGNKAALVSQGKGKRKEEVKKLSAFQKRAGGEFVFACPQKGADPPSPPPGDSARNAGRGKAAFIKKPPLKNLKN